MIERGTRDWFAERGGEEGEHPVDAEVRERIGSGLEAERDQRITYLKQVVTGALNRRAEPWLELEELLGERAGAREAAYYNLGVDIGRTSEVAERIAGEGGADPRDALRAISALGSALAELSRRALASAELAPRVLVVDDEELVARSFSRLLSTRFEVHTCASAETALASLEQLGFDALVTDYDMPGHDGAWLLREAAWRSPGTRRVLASGGVVPGLEDLLARGTAEAFVTKTRAASELLPLLLRMTSTDHPP